MAEASAGATFTFTPDTYTWAEGGKQTVTIKATAANESEKGTIERGTITFTNIETNETIEVKVTQKSSYVAPSAGTDVPYALSNFSGGSTSGAALTVKDPDVNISLSANGYKTNAYVRIYANGAIVVTPNAGKIITSVVITATKDYIKTWKASSGEISVSGNTATWKGDSTSAITLTNTASGQARITKVVVTYK